MRTLNKKRKRKKKPKKAPVEPSRDSTPSPLRRAKKEATNNKLREEAWLQNQKNVAGSIGASEQRSSSISSEVDQHYVIIKDVNPPSEMRRVVIPFWRARQNNRTTYHLIFKPAIGTFNSSKING